MKQGNATFSCKTLMPTGVLTDGVHLRLTVILLILERDSWNGRDENSPSLVSICARQCHSVPGLSVLISSSFYLSFLQEEKGISCGLVDLDFLKCSVGFPFMRAQTKVAHTGKQQCSVALLRML